MQMWWMDCGSETSAVRSGIGGGELGCAAHLRVSVSFVGFRPARAKDLSGEEGEGLRNLRASRTTYLPVKPEAPRIMKS